MKKEKNNEKKQKLKQLLNRLVRALLFVCIVICKDTHVYVKIISRCKVGPVCPAVVREKILCSVLVVQYKHG